MKKVFFVLVLTFVISFSVHARRRYSAQGCGVGSMFLTNDSLFHNVLGATTNATFLHTFAMSFGTSNCYVGGRGRRSQNVFIEANKVALKNDIARGNGSTIVSLGRMYGCNNNKMVGKILQQNYKSIFPTENTSAQDINYNIRNVIINGARCKM